MDTERNTRVSVIMISTGADKGLSRRLESMTEQLGAQDEVLFITREADAEDITAIARGTKAKTVAGAAFSEKMEAALRQATGQYLFLAESCDTWHPGKRKACVAVLEQGAMAVVHDAVVVDGDLNEINGSLLGHRFRTGLFSCLFRSRFVGCCLAFRREVLTAALPIPPYVSYDRWLIAAARSIGRVVYVDRALIFYCNSTATKKLRVFNMRRKRIGFRGLYSVYKLNRRIRKRFTDQPRDTE